MEIEQYQQQIKYEEIIILEFLFYFSFSETNQTLRNLEQTQLKSKESHTTYTNILIHYISSQILFFI